MPAVAINGLGRIGRAVLKIVLDTPQLELAGLNDLSPAENIAYLLQYDSVYGKYGKEVKAHEERLMVDGKAYRICDVKDPEKLPWKEWDIDLVFECTGVFRTRDDMAKHLQAGAKKVIVSAPEKTGDVPTIVHGVNRSASDDDMISCASCTTNCITPVVEVMTRRIGIEKAVMTTIHAYTSSQSMVDGPKNKWRRGRAAAVNFVPTSTGAAKATTKVLTALRGKFDGIAVRGPVPVGSIADMVFITRKTTSASEINKVFREEARSDRYSGILGVSEDPIVSTDIVGDSRASIMDLTLTQVVDGNLAKVLSWYDNEWGYASQMVREALRMTT